MKTFFIAILILFSLIFASFVIKIIFFPINTAEKILETAYDAQDETLNAENAIYNYEYFKNQKESIDATKQKLMIARDSVERFKEEAGERSTWTFEDKNEYSRLNAVSQGIESQLKDMIADYNAKSSMANRAIFKDSIVPNYIDSLTFIKQ